MERINIDEEFRDWVIGNMPLHFLIGLYRAYTSDAPFVAIVSDMPKRRPGLDELSREEFEEELNKLREQIEKGLS